MTLSFKGESSCQRYQSHYVSSLFASLYQIRNGFIININKQQLQRDIRRANTKLTFHLWFPFLPGEELRLCFMEITEVNSSCYHTDRLFKMLHRQGQIDTYILHQVARKNISPFKQSSVSLAFFCKSFFILPLFKVVFLQLFGSNTIVFSIE